VREIYGEVANQPFHAEAPVATPARPQTGVPPS